MQGWISFSVITVYMFSLCWRSSRLSPTTPRLVFSWFLYSHHICVAVGATGYILFLAELLGAGKLVAKLFGDKASVLLLWYGLYFGILGRDTAEVAFSGLVWPESL
jgi:RING finger protein 121/175